MKTLKKALSVILGLAIMLSCVMGMQVSVAADAEGTNLELAVGEATVAGTTVTVPINVVTNPGFAQLAVEVDYDENVLELVSGVKNKAFSDSVDAGVCGPTTAETFRMMWAFWGVDGTEANGNANITATDTIATLTFEVVDDTVVDSTYIDITVTEAWDVNGAAVTATATDGTVNFVTEPECKHVVGEVTSAVPATSENAGVLYGICSVCGENCEVPVEYYANIKTAYAAAELAGETSLLLSARNDRLAEKGAYDRAFIYIQHTISGDGTNRVTIKDISEATDTLQGSSNRPSKTWKYGVKSLQYTETVINNVFVYAGGKWYSGEQISYSLRSYIDERLAQTNDADEKALYANLLAFGEEMQKIKGYNLENLATAGLSDDILALIKDGDATMTDVVVEEKPADNDAAYINKYGFDMADKIVAMMYFRTDRYTGTNKDDYKIVATWKNARGLDKEIIIRKDGSVEPADMYYVSEMQNGAPRANRYTFNFDQMASYDFRQQVTFSFYDGEKLMSKYTASYEALVKGSIDQGTFTGAWVTVSNRLLHYSDAAKAYFCK